MTINNLDLDRLGDLRCAVLDAANSEGMSHAIAALSEFAGAALAELAAERAAHAETRKQYDSAEVAWCVKLNEARQEAEILRDDIAGTVFEREFPLPWEPTQGETP